MKKRVLLFTGSIVLFSTLIMSYENGPAHTMASDFSGAPGSAMNCSGCHSGGNTSTPTNAAIEVRKLSTGTVVTSYNPDTVYIIKITGSNAASNLTRFGFNFLAVKTSQTSTSVGTYSAFPANVGSATANGRTIVEHTDALTTTGGQYVTTFNWKAPAAGMGSVNMYAIINAVNNNGDDDATDKVSPVATVTLAEVNPLAVNEISAELKISAYPNPVSTQLHIDMDNAAEGSYTINVFDMNGKIVASKVAAVNGSFHTTFNTASWAAGIYHLQLKNGNAQRTIAISKQ